ncbi:MAG TPA: Fic family protein [Acidimicrobiales bacterium]|nr:Fic family protein [Acidimicrobiales bacterium]
MTIVPVVGPGALPGDMPLPHGLSLSGPARSLIENVDLRGRRPTFRAGTAAVEDQIDALARSGGVTGIQRSIDQLDVIAGSFDPSATQTVRTRLLAVLGSPSGGPLGITSSRLGARLAGQPFDQQRLELIEGLVEVLEARAPRPVAMIGPAEAWAWLPFFESYFSNFIEGTEFGVEEARRIAVEGEVPADRPADAHDVAATYRLAADPVDQLRTPRSGEQLVEMLAYRHRVLMAARPQKRPGEFKVKPNYAGGYQFVLPELVEGTLVRGFDLVDVVTDPLGRAVAMMALVAECHPFDDGNGRVARLTSNAELSVAGQVRIVIPTVYRNNYLAALSGMSGGAGKGQALVAVLEYAQRWVAAVDWRDYQRSLETLTACNALIDPGVAEVNGQRLVMPRMP